MRNTASRKSSLDSSIDSFLDAIFGLIGRNLGRIGLVGVILATFWLVAMPSYRTWLPLVGTGLLMLFQLAFAMVFMIIQFVALFWFLGRGRTYWVKPGETGVGFKDYK
ncbi:MAG TPA: ATPase, partial [Chloroflexota bacterium]